MNDFFNDGMGNVKPYVVAFRGQTPEEVAELLKKDEESQPKTIKDCFSSCSGVGPSEDAIKEASECLKKAKKIKLAFDDAPDVTNDYFPDLSQQRSDKPRQVDLNLCHTWRRLADVNACEENGPCLPDDIGPVQELMDIILFRIKHKFPKLKCNWGADWNPALFINESRTQISMAKLSTAYNGMLNIANEAVSREIITDIVLKKLGELFI